MDGSGRGGLGAGIRVGADGVGWWHREVVAPGKLPLLLALAALLVTFGVTRLVTRMIRAGKGPFRNVTPGGVHIHHAVPGIVLMVVGGFGGVAAGRQGFGATAAAVAFGMGAGLVLDEFALIVHLQDVYWSPEGTRSVETVLITATLAALLLFGFAPFGTDGMSGAETHDRWGLIATIVFNLAMSLVALLKGKLRMAVLGVLVPLVSLIGAVRLARPGSYWARRCYRDRPRATARAERRAARHDHRWSGLRTRVEYLIGGRPSPP